MTIKVVGQLRQGGLQTSSAHLKTRIVFQLNPGQSVQMAQLIELMERGVSAKFAVKGDKGTDIEFMGSVWKVRTMLDGGVSATFEMQKGNAVNTAILSDSMMLLETLTIEIGGENGIQTGTIRQSEWAAIKREYPN